MRFLTMYVCAVRSAADAPPPEAVLTQNERMQRYGDDPRVPARVRAALAQRAALPFPLDLRLVDPVDKVDPAARPARQLAWMRAPEPLGDDPALHRCVVAYGSDFALLETALLPHAKAILNRQLRAASLDHAMWFHRPFRADEWLLYEIESPAASGAMRFARHSARRAVRVSLCARGCN
jgi:acyl-CoA thioesterase-2